MVTPVIVEKIVIDGESLSLREKVILETGKKNFEFYYNGLNFLSKKVRFQYKLEGFDEHWSNETTLRFTFKVV